MDRSCIERLKVFQNPPVLVGFVMEMVMILIGKKSTGDRIEKRDAYPSRDESSGRFSASSGSTKYTTTSKKRRFSAIIMQYYVLFTTIGYIM